MLQCAVTGYKVVGIGVDGDFCVAEAQVLRVFFASARGPAVVSHLTIRERKLTHGTPLVGVFVVAPVQVLLLGIFSIPGT